MDPIRVIIRRPVFTAMLVLSVVVFGLYALPRMGVDQFPDVEFPVVTVTTVLPGADPETVEKDVSEPLEEALNTLSGIDSLRSISGESVSQLIVRFELSKNADIAAQEVRDRVQTTLMKLPSDVRQPVVEKFDVGAAPVAQVALSGPLPIVELTELAEDDIKPAFQHIRGVGGVDIVGGREREIRVVLDLARLRSYGLAASDVVQALRSQDVDVPGGRTYVGDSEQIVTLQSEVDSPDELAGLILASPGGAPVRLRDVAQIIDGPAEARSAATLDGRSAVGLVIRKQSDANTVAVADAVKAALPEITHALPKEMRLDVVVDGAKFIRNSIRSVQEDMILGAILAVLIVLVFLRNLRSTLVAAIALPTSIIGTFAAMQALDFTFNIVTMLALTLSIGLLVDDAIVIIENIVRQTEDGKPPFEAALHGAKQIALAVLAVTLSVVAVFIPVAFMEGMMGRFFYQFGVTVAVAVLLSYGVSMTLTPMMSARVITGHGESNAAARVIERALTRLEGSYRRLLRYSLAHPLVTVAIAFAVFAASIGLGSLLKFTFIPPQDMGQARVTLELPAGTRLGQTERALESLRTQVAAQPGVVSTYATVGGGVRGEVNKGEVFVNLVPIAERTFSQQEFKEHLRNSLRHDADAKLAVLDYSPIQGGSAARSQQVQFNIRGDDWSEVQRAADKTLAYMKTQPGLVDVDSTYRAGKPQLSVYPERARAAELGVPAAMVGLTLRTLLSQDKVASLREGGKSYDIKVGLSEGVLAQPDTVGSITVRGAMGQLVEVRNISRIVRTTGPAMIERQAQKRQITLLADLQDYSLGEALDTLSTFAAHELEPSITTDFEGMGRELGNAMRSFILALLLGVVLLYMILAAQFESLLDPFTIMLALPLALVGAILSLLLTGQFMSMFAMIGIIMLMGLVAKNGILLVEFTNQLRHDGKGVREALLTAGPLRLRPILMTTVAMIAGMIPVALARGDGAETRVPMAITIIGGLVTSTLLTLVVIPSVYLLLDRLRGKRLWGDARVPVVAAQPSQD
jgi:HAE1 family hydrophobic/amphiphilic exporter-1